MLGDPAADSAGPGDWPWAALTRPAGAPAVPFPRAGSPEASVAQPGATAQEQRGRASRQAAWPASFPADSGFRPRGSSRLGLCGARSPSAATAPGLSMEGAHLPPPAAPPLSAETCGVRRVTGRGVLSSGLSHSHRRALEVLPTASFPGSQPRPLPLQRLPQGRRPRGDLGRLAGSATPGSQCPHGPASRPAGAGCGRARPAPSGSTSWGLGTAAPDGADATAR